MPYIIRTSDRGQFKSCRQKWDFGSKIRMNFEPKTNAKPLEFGTAFHKGMERFYDPDLQGLPYHIRCEAAVAAFDQVCRDQSKGYVALKGTLDDLVKADFNERVELGHGMLNYYFEWSKHRDRFDPVKVEVEFEVPIPVPEHLGSILFETRRGMFSISSDGYLLCDLEGTPEPVLYQGRIDMIVKDENGDLWVFDHKTAGQRSAFDWLPLDDQITSYVWAMHQLGIPVVGFIYNEFIKGYPEPPRVLKSGALSEAKNQDTTYELYLKAIHDGGYKEEAYAEILDYLRANEKTWIRRQQMRRNTREIMNQGDRIFLEAIDMLGNPSIYPNPSKFNCNGCWFYAPCLARCEGSDFQTILETNYTKRSETKEKEPVS